MDLKTPWPSVPDRPLGYLAEPKAEVRADNLRLWFDVDGSAVLAVAVSLHDL
jgi:hypothetical protein